MRFTRKPTTIEAEQYLGEVILGVCTCDQELGHHLHTAHEGQTVRLTKGDWIIPEKEPGRYYPCKPDIFEATYTPAKTTFNGVVSIEPERLVGKTTEEQAAVIADALELLGMRMLDELADGVPRDKDGRPL